MRVSEKRRIIKDLSLSVVNLSSEEIYIFDVLIFFLLQELESTVEKWLHDLGEQEKAFLNQAAQVNTWDKQLIQNGEKVTELYNEVHPAIIILTKRLFLSRS